MELQTRIRGALGGPFAKKVDVEVTPALLHRLGKCLVDSFIKESKKDFAKRGWSGEARDGGPPIWESFRYRIRGDKTVEVTSTFPYLAEMAAKDTQPYKMTWLTQEAKDKRPAEFPLTPREKELKMRRAGHVSQGQRLPLVVPLEDKGGVVVFRTAPLTFQDAWVHPGIARFTFVERAAKKGREQCIKILQEEVLKTVVQELTE